MYNSMYNYCGNGMVRAVVRRWGNSFGVVLPKEAVRKHRLSESDIVDIQIVATVRPVHKLFGTLKTRKSAQKMKDESRAIWDD